MFRPNPPPALQRWRARLALAFLAADGVTRLAHNRHDGPLRLLKALASEDGQGVEAVIVHPPGGLAGGDSLDLAIELGAGCRVLATTPGAQKWYRADAPAQSQTRLAVGAGALLEWLPQLAILFDGARADQRLAIDVAADGACIGWEQLARGRAAMGERFGSGTLAQSIELAVAGRLIWREQLVAAASDPLFGSPLGWNARRAAASVWCCAPALPAERLARLRDRWRDLLAASVCEAGATLVADGLLLAKLLGNDNEALQSACTALWQAARISLTGDAGAPPRIWRT
ncbi:MAG: urease accessory protein UreD [Lautropia sp.]